MSASYDDSLSLLYDVPLPAVTEKGHGAHLHPKTLQATYTNVAGTKGGRGIFLWPIQTQPGSGWKTTTTASTVYERKRLTTTVAYTATGTVTDFEWGIAGDWWQRMSASATLTTTGTGWTGGASGNLRPNPWLHLAFWCYGTHNTNAEVLTLEWGLTDHQFRLHIYGGGWAVLQQNDGSGTYVTCVEGQLFPDGATNRACSLLIAPLFHRCLVMWGSGKGELIYEDMFKDPNTADYTDPNATSPLVGAGTCKITAVVRAEVQLSECAFNATGSVRAAVTLPYAPTTGNDPFWDNPDSGLLTKADVPTTGTYVSTEATLTISAVDTGTTDAWAADGSSRAFDLLAEFVPGVTGDGYDRITPVLYTTGYRFIPLYDDRDDNNSSWLNNMKAGATLECDGERSRLTLTLMSSDAYRVKQNRFIALGCGTDEVFRGFTGDPSYDLSTDAGATTLEEVTYTCEDEWKRLEKIMVPPSYDFGGMLWTSAVKQVLAYAGYTAARWDIGTSGFTLPAKETNEQDVSVDVSMGGEGEPDVDATAGMQSQDVVSVAEWLRNLRDAYSNWDMGFKPVGGLIKFVARDPFENSVTGAFYTTRASAIAAGGDNRDCVRNLKYRLAEPEANEIHVWGEAPGGVPIHSQWPAVGVVNPDSVPTTAEIDRSVRWVGEPRIVQYIDPQLNTTALCDWVCTILFRKLVPAVGYATFDAEWHPDVHMWDWVTIDGTAFRVTGYTVTFEGETTVSGSKNRVCSYQCQRDVWS
jgi:hypothetical protein